MIRQMQSIIAKQAQQGDNSEYDSWSDLEENFAREYEPIPFHIRMETWRGMSKRDILKTIRSKKMRKELEDLTHSEILSKIEVLQKNAKQLSAKFGVDHLLPHMDHIVQVHRGEVEGEEERQIYASKSRKQPHQQQHRHQAKQSSRRPLKQHDSWSSRASSILNNPESIYVSRGEVLKNLQNDAIINAKHHVPKKTPRRESEDHYSRGKSRRQHGSWSSHASSIMANAALAEKEPTYMSRAEEPNYMSRAEVLNKLADAAYDTLSKHSTSEDSDASTVKSVVAAKSKSRPQPEYAFALPAATKTTTAKVKELQRRFEEQLPSSPIPSSGGDSASDTCSCTSCENYYSGDDYCSCCNGDYGEEEEDLKDDEDGSHRSNSSAATVVDVGSRSNSRRTGTDSKESVAYSSNSAGRDKGKRSGSSSGNRNSNGVSVSPTSADISKSNKQHGELRRSSVSSAEYSGDRRRRKKESEAAAAVGDSNSSSENGRIYTKKRNSTSSSSESKKMSTKTTSAASSFSSSREERQLRPRLPILAGEAASEKIASEAGSGRRILSSLQSVAESAEKIYQPVGLSEIQRQKNERILRRHLRELATDWNSRIDDLNTLRRTRVMKELKRYLRGNIDLDTAKPEDIGRQVGELLRQALDSNFEALSNLNLGHMYVPMEEETPEEIISPLGRRRRGLLNRECTDYDTFGSIDSLIFEPKFESKEDIKKAHNEIDLQFRYLDREEAGTDSQEDRRSSKSSVVAASAKDRDEKKGPGKTTFAERVKLFQNLGKKTAKKQLQPPPPTPKNKKITFLDVTAQPETSWKELNEKKGSSRHGDILSALAERSSGVRTNSKLPVNDERTAGAATPNAVDKKRVKGLNNDNITFAVRKENNNNNGQEEVAIDDEEYDNCPYCNHEYSISTGACSTCDTCTQCGLSAAEEEIEEDSAKRDPSSDGKGEQPSFNHSVAATSWNYLNSDKRSDEDEDDTESSLSAAESVIDMLNEVHQAAAAATAQTPSPTNTEKPIPISEHNLRRQLKDAFGSSPAASPVNNANGNNIVVAHFTTVASFCDEGGKKLLPLLPTDFLSDYSSRKELADVEGAVLLREGETVRLTEEMFRGSNNAGRRENSGSETGAIAKKKAALSGSEMGDSGISSPPFGAPSLALSPRPPIVEEDSGVEETGLGDKANKGGLLLPPPKKVPVRKRDTMIRELKTKLKERFRHQDDDALEETSSRSSSCSSSEGCSSAKASVAVGTVESRRDSVAPQLGRLFANHGSPRMPPNLARQNSLASSSHTQSSSAGAAAVAPPALPPKATPSVSVVSRNESARSATMTTTFKSIYESRMVNKAVMGENVYFESGSSAYDPPLPDELKKSVPAGIMFRDTSRPFTPPASVMGPSKPDRAAPPAKEPPCVECEMAETKAGCGNLTLSEARHLVEAGPEERREFLYGPGGVFGPKGPFSTPIVRYPHGLEVNQLTKRSNVVQFADPALNKNVVLLVNDDCGSSSVAVAEDRSVKSHYVVNSILDVDMNKDKAVGPPKEALEQKKGASRMETYRADWADQECLPSKPSRPLLPEDVERWKEEKARRMLAWINNSQLTGYWGSETPWWKVMLQEVEAAAIREFGDGKVEAGGGGSGGGGEKEGASAKELQSFFDSLNLDVPSRKQ
jgi:hypothetical protein